MPRFLLLSLSLICLTASVNAQNDSVPVPVQDTAAKSRDTVVKAADTVTRRVTRPPITRREPPPEVQDTTPVIETFDSALADSVSKKPIVYGAWPLDPNLPFAIQILAHHPYYGFTAKPIVVHSMVRTYNGKELLFYVLIGFLLTFSLLREAFPKYFNDLVRLLFRTTLKQKQIREQLMQTPLPSLLLNIFFTLSAGLYINILLHHFGRTPVDNFWLLFIYCSLGLAAIYIVKMVGLKVTGWLFNIQSAANAYIFVVYIINKVIGIFLLPFLILLSFLQGDSFTVMMILSLCGVGVLLVYRVLLTYSSVRNQVKFNPFHFFLYLCAFEIAPLLLIYKALLFFFQ